MFFYQGINKVKVVHLHKEDLLSWWNKETKKFEDKGMKQEKSRPEWGISKPKEQTSYGLMDKWILVVK